MTAHKKLLPYGDEPRIPTERKRPRSIRFDSETLRKLDAAAERFGVSATHYVTLALRNQFKQDQID
jgi:hypothetical protein